MLLDDLGHPIGVLSQQNRVILTPAQIPQIVKEAVISIEDKRFYTNSGIDMRGIARAFVQDIVHKGSVQGASTIEQQFIKNALQAQSHRTIFEKLQRGRARLPARAQVVQGQDHHRLPEHDLLRQRRLRDRGRGARPTSATTSTTSAAARPATSCASQQLEPWEAALLAGIIQNPDRLQPGHHPAAALERRNVVLEQMLEQGYLTAPVYDESIKQALPAPHEVQPPQEQTVEGVDAGYFTSWVQQQVIERYGAAARLRRRPEDHTRRWTSNCSAPPNRRSTTTSPTRAARPPRSSRSKTRPARCARWSAGATTTKAPFNLATEGERQPGSSFKAFDLAAALEDGISPDSVWTSKVRRRSSSPTPAAPKSSSCTTTKAPTPARTR